MQVRAGDPHGDPLGEPAEVGGGAGAGSGLSSDSDMPHLPSPQPGPRRGLWAGGAGSAQQLPPQEIHQGHSASRTAGGAPG